MAPVFTNDAVVLGILIVTLALVFTAERRFPKVFRVLPALLLCYFVPALLHDPLHLIAPHWYVADLWPVLAKAGLSLPQNASYAEVQEAIGQRGLDEGGLRGVRTWVESVLHGLAVFAAGGAGAAVFEY